MEFDSWRLAESRFAVHALQSRIGGYCATSFEVLRACRRTAGGRDHLDHLRPADLKILLRETAVRRSTRAPAQPSTCLTEMVIFGPVLTDLNVESAGRSLLAGVDAATNWRQRCSSLTACPASTRMRSMLPVERRLSQRRDLRPRAGRKAIGVRLASRSVGVSRGRRRTAGGTPFRARPGS